MPLLYALVARRTAVLAEYRCVSKPAGFVENTLGASTA
jgi:hypothetical protein